VSSSPKSFEETLVAAVLVDAGPLVGLVDRADADHEACVASLKRLSGPLVTVWPAFTEAMYLLRGSWQGQKALWSRLETDALALAPLDEADAPRMRELMEQYRDLPMDLADAALVRVAERESLTQIFTLDRKHFSIYRPGRRRRFSIVPS
jgi:predicted nucleic acid-binding protein